MKHYQLYILAVMLIMLSSCYKPCKTQSHLKLWYNQPAKVSTEDSNDWLKAIKNRVQMSIPDGWKNDTDWLETLSLGNGSLGLMVYGDVNREQIQLNEESMRSGSPDDNNNPDAHAAQDKIRQLLCKLPCAKSAGI